MYLYTIYWIKSLTDRLENARGVSLFLYANQKSEKPVQSEFSVYTVEIRASVIGNIWYLWNQSNRTSAQQKFVKRYCKDTI